MNSSIRVNAIAKLIPARHPHPQAHAPGDQAQMVGGLRRVPARKVQA